jgi:hypothetical protein
MANRLQWVNFPDADKVIGATHVVRSKYTDGDVTTVNAMSSKLYVGVKFEKKEKLSAATLTIKPDGGNAAYSATEKAHPSGVYAPGLTSACTINKNGFARFPVNVTPAGGDVFEFEAKSSKGTVKKYSQKVETRRKLYYQIIKMRKAAGLSGAMTGRVERQYWKESAKHYIKFEQYASGRTIPNRVNFDDTDNGVETAVKDAARKKYDKSKAPFAVVVVIVNKNCIPGNESLTVPAVFNGGKYLLATLKRLFWYADRAVAWFHGMTFTPAGGGVPVPIPLASITIKGPKLLEIDTAALPHAAGNLQYSITIIDIVGMGLSLPNENLVTVACRSWDGSPVPAGTMAAIMTHEVGHKVGMVPGPQGDPDIDRQGSYYDGRGHSGPHCRHPAPLLPAYQGSSPAPPPSCTMFGDVRTKTVVFCTNCQKSVRKLDVSPDRKVGIANQF